MLGAGMPCILAQAKARNIPLGLRCELYSGPGTSCTVSLASERPSTGGKGVRRGQGRKRRYPPRVGTWDLESLKSRWVKPGGSEGEACAGSSALYRARKPAACGPLSFHPPGLREGQRTYKKKIQQQQKNISLTPKRTLFNEVENSSTQIAFSTTL